MHIGHNETETFKTITLLSETWDRVHLYNVMFGE